MRLLNFLPRHGFFVAVSLGLALAGCGDDELAGGGKPDTTPPAVTSVTPIDAYQIEIAFNENLQRESAELTNHYEIYEGTVAAAAQDASSPGDPLAVWAAALGADQRTVILTTDSMLVAPYDLTVAGVEDAHGNEIVTPVEKSFTGTADPDVTPPALVYRSPGPNAKNVAIGSDIYLTFSEPISYYTLLAAFRLISSGGTVSYTADSFDGGVHIVVTPDDPLRLAESYEVTLDGIQDYAGNTMATTTWSFTTAITGDDTPPALVSSSPADLATHVDVNTFISVTFSEAIDQVEFYGEIAPFPSDGDIMWSNAGKTFTFDPYDPLAPDQQYVLSFPPGGVRDLAGNGNVEPFFVRFTTGNAIAAGSITGTIGGDPNSDFANDPTGALVVAFDAYFFAAAGSNLVASNDSYDIRHLPDGGYYVYSAMNTDGDTDLGSDGDAFGVFGADIPGGDFEADSVAIVGGDRVTGLDFPLFDPSVITGSVYYEGIYSGGYAVYVGAFNVVGFDPLQPPDFSDYTYPNDRFSIDSLDEGLVDGTYYIGAFWDIDGNGLYDPSSEPAGFYGGDPPTAIDIRNGSDVLGIAVVLRDPSGPASPSAHVAWQAGKQRAPQLTRLRAAIRENLAAKATAQPTGGVLKLRLLHAVPASKASPAAQGWGPIGAKRR